MNNDVSKTIKTPAIALIVAGSINGAVGVAALLGGFVRLLWGNESLPVNEAERMGFIGGTVIGYGIALLTLLAAPLIIYGGTQMLSGKRYGLAKAAAIAAIIPFTNCCFLIGIPIGIWALTVLFKPEVKDYFAGIGTGSQIPPAPPEFGG
ncbi:MAG: hypothetical protein HKN33_09915 [Pyrinomonadaceae bacterium]|nr:hypothetical protein [Pyrinomonadaceae bacterium]